MWAANQVKSMPQHFSIFAMRRSGHHAVINWIRWSLPLPVVFFNDCEPHTVQAHSHAKSLHLSWRSRECRLPGHWQTPLRIGLPLVSLCENFEDSLCFQHAAYSTTVLVLRDFYNIMASRLQWERTFRARFRDPANVDTDVLDNMIAACSLWEQMASVAVSEPPSPIVCLYDKWLRDAKYRSAIAARLGIRENSVALNRTARWGPGSSFTGQHEKVNPDALCNRFRAFSDDDIYRRICRNARCMRLNIRLFGSTESNMWGREQCR